MVPDRAFPCPKTTLADPRRPLSTSDGSTTALARAVHVASPGSAPPPGGCPRQSNHHHLVTPSHRLSNLISHFGTSAIVASNPPGGHGGCSRIPGGCPRQSNHHHTVTPSHRLSNLISHFGGHELRPSRPTVTLPIYNNFTFSIVVKDGVTV